MQRRKFLTHAIGTSAALMATTRVGGATTSKPITWKMTTSWPKNAPGVGTSANRLAEYINTLSGGRMQVKVYAGGELVSPLQALDALQTGVAEIAHTAAYYAAGKSPALHFFTTIPFGLSATEYASWLEFGGGQLLWDELMQSFGVRAFYAGNSGAQAMGWFRKEINSIDDLKGLKIRIAGLGGESMKRLGAVPVLTAPSEIFQALSQGTVDAAEWVGPWNDMAFGLQKAAKIYYLPGFHEPSAALAAFINEKALLALPEDLQLVVKLAAKAAAQDTLSEFLYNNTLALPKLIELGVQVRHFNDEIIAALRDASKEVVAQIMEHDALTKKIGASYLNYLSLSKAYSQSVDLAMLQQRTAN